MAEQCNVRNIIDQNREGIIALVKEEAKTKKYFNGLALPAEQIIDIVAKDYLETIVLCYETGSLSTFEEKLNWFFPMYNSRKSQDHPDNTNSDFFKVLSNILLAKCENTDHKLIDTLNKMETLITSYESRNSK